MSVMRTKGGREDGDCSVLVSDCGDRFTYFFLTGSFLFKNTFRFPLSKQVYIIGDFVTNRQRAGIFWCVSPICIVFVGR